MKKNDRTERPLLTRVAPVFRVVIMTAKEDPVEEYTLATAPAAESGQATTAKPAKSGKSMFSSTGKA